MPAPSFYTMKKVKLLILFLLIHMIGFTQQNLVINPSFEDYYMWDYPYPFCDSLAISNNTYNPNLSSPTFCHSKSCFMQGIPYNVYGVQTAFQGNAYYSNNIYHVFDSISAEHDLFREYISLQLLSQLTSGHRYCVEFYVSLSDSSAYATDRIQALLTDTMIYYDTIGAIPLLPQIENPIGRFLDDNKKWMKVNGSYIASGGERFITIGNFYDNEHSDSLRIHGPEHYPNGSYYIYACANYFIDMVSVFECDNNPQSAYAGEDKIICPGDSVMIGTFSNKHYDYHWEPAEGLAQPDSGITYARPQQTTTYTLTQNYFGLAVTTDAVTVVVDDCLDNSIYIPNVFSPNGDGQNDVLYIRGQGFDAVHIMIYNRWGEKVFESSDIGKGWDGTFKGKKCPAGVYFYVGDITFKNGEKLVRKGDVSLVR